MINNGIEQLVDKWFNEAGFREKMEHDPEGTVRKSGLKLNAEEWASLRNVVISTSDEALCARISKGKLHSPMI